MYIQLLQGDPLLGRRVLILHGALQQIFGGDSRSSTKQQQQQQQLPSPAEVAVHLAGAPDYLPDKPLRGGPPSVSCLLGALRISSPPCGLTGGHRAAETPDGSAPTEGTAAGGGAADGDAAASSSSGSNAALLAGAVDSLGVLMPEIEWGDTTRSTNGSSSSNNNGSSSNTSSSSSSSSPTAGCLSSSPGSAWRLPPSAEETAAAKIAARLLLLLVRRCPQLLLAGDDITEEQQQEQQEETEGAAATAVAAAAAMEDEGAQHPEETIDNEGLLPWERELLAPAKETAAAAVNGISSRSSSSNSSRSSNSSSSNNSSSVPVVPGVGFSVAVSAEGLTALLSAVSRCAACIVPPLECLAETETGSPVSPELNKLLSLWVQARDYCLPSLESLLQLLFAALHAISVPLVEDLAAAETALKEIQGLFWIGFRRSQLQQTLLLTASCLLVAGQWLGTRCSTRSSSSSSSKLQQQQRQQKGAMEAQHGEAMQWLQGLEGFRQEVCPLLLLLLQLLLLLLLLLLLKQAMLLVQQQQ